MLNTRAHIQLFYYGIYVGQYVTTQQQQQQPFYGSVEFVRENPGEPVPEETFTHYFHHSHQSSLSAFSI